MACVAAGIIAARLCPAGTRCPYKSIRNDAVDMNGAGLIFIVFLSSGTFMMFINQNPCDNECQHYGSTTRLSNPT